MFADRFMLAHAAANSDATCPACKQKSLVAEKTYVDGLCPICYDITTRLFLLECKHGVCSLCLERIRVRTSAQAERASSVRASTNPFYRSKSLESSDTCSIHESDIENSNVDSMEPLVSTDAK